MLSVSSCSSSGPAGAAVGALAAAGAAPSDEVSRVLAHKSVVEKKRCVGSL
jgi:hypothetical protein